MDFRKTFSINKLLFINRLNKCVIINYKKFIIKKVYYFYKIFLYYEMDKTIKGFNKLH